MTGAAVVTVVGAAGGCGASTLAGALALHRARAGAAVWLVELDVDRGDRAEAWDLAPERTLADLAAVADELDAGHLARAAHEHDTGVRLLLAPGEPGTAGAWAPAATERLLSAARDAVAAGGWVVADAGTGLGPRAAAAADLADVTLVVCPPTIAGARRARRIAEAAPGRCALAVAGPAGQELGARALARAVGAPVAAELPWEPREASRLSVGRWPSGRRTCLAAAVGALAETLS